MSKNPPLRFSLKQIICKVYEELFRFFFLCPWASTCGESQINLDPNQFFSPFSLLLSSCTVQSTDYLLYNGLYIPEKCVSSTCVVSVGKSFCLNRRRGRIPRKLLNAHIISRQISAAKMATHKQHKQQRNISSRCRLLFNKHLTLFMDYFLVNFEKLFYSSLLRSNKHLQ